MGVGGPAPTPACGGPGRGDLASLSPITRRPCRFRVARPFPHAASGRTWGFTGSAEPGTRTPRGAEGSGGGGGCGPGAQWTCPVGPPALENFLMVSSSRGSGVAKRALARGWLGSPVRGRQFSPARRAELDSGARGPGRGGALWGGRRTCLRTGAPEAGWLSAGWNPWTSPLTPAQVGSQARAGVSREHLPGEPGWVVGRAPSSPKSWGARRSGQLPSGRRATSALTAARGRG